MVPTVVAPIRSRSGVCLDFLFFCFEKLTHWSGTIKIILHLNSVLVLLLKLKFVYNNIAKLKFSFFLIIYLHTSHTTKHHNMNSKTIVQKLSLLQITMIIIYNDKATQYRLFPFYSFLQDQLSSLLNLNYCPRFREILIKLYCCFDNVAFNFLNSCVSFSNLPLFHINTPVSRLIYSTREFAVILFAVSTIKFKRALMPIFLRHSN